MGGNLQLILTTRIQYYSVKIEMIVILCIIALIIVVWVHYHTEPFAPSTSIPTFDQDLEKNYRIFATEFYNPFLITWQQAIVSLMTADAPQEEATSPSQSMSSSKPQVPPMAEMNAQIVNLSQKEGKRFPPITEPLPETINISTFPSIAPKIPTDPTPYTNALEWMNKQLQEAHEKLQSALRGESFKDLEGFDNQTCQDLSKCFKDNPELLQQYAAAVQTQQQQSQQQVGEQIKRFLNQPNFVSARAANKTLVEQSKQVQNQAKSGELLNQIDLPQEPSIKYELPEGSDKLSKLDYATIQQIKETSPAMFSIKGLIDQINRNLR